jgi:hypothetical protein
MTYFDRNVDGGIWNCTYLIINETFLGGGKEKRCNCKYKVNKEMVESKQKYEQQHLK